MKYLIMNGDTALGEKAAQWLLQMTPPQNIRVGIADSEKRAFFKKLKITPTLIDYSDANSIKRAISKSNVVAYIPKISDLASSITQFEQVLTHVKQANAVLIFVSFFADQEKNPYLYSPFYGYALRRLAASGVKYTIIKNSLFADSLVDELSRIIKKGELTCPLKARSVSFITQNDSAHAIATACIQKVMHGHSESYLLTMERNYNMVELAYLMTRATEKSIMYNPTNLSDFLTHNPQAKLKASLYKAAQEGMLGQTSDDFRKLTGREPEELEHFLRNGYQISKLHALNL